ncbi:MAG: hypothetical protein PF486_11360 [Prolixibacteraceae bacterium]|jgi:hypothetical protein|nr:hypothetical protein [Prolixibacteraceae bacterium]
MKRILVNMFLLVLLLGCSVSKKLERNYLGQGREYVLKQKGEPTKIIELENDNERFIYVEEEEIRETTIGTGKATLDPKISPGFTKIEIYRFEVNEKGIIVGAGYEKLIKK